MKVTDVDIHVVSVPFVHPETWRYGRLWGLTSAIVEVFTDDGLVGVGECPGSPLIGLVVPALEATKPWIIGEDPRRITSFLHRCHERGWHHYPYIGNGASAAFEMALWDICGKALGCPVHQFFGGLHSERVPFYWYIWVSDREPSTARAEAQEGLARGFKTMYLKIGFDVEQDVALAQAVRDEVGPDIAIRVDPNEAWTAFEARRAVRLFESVGLEFLEQPTSMHHIGALADLRKECSTRIGANQSVWFRHQVLDVLGRRAADVIVTDQHQLGSLSAFRDVAGFCETADVPLVKHAFGDLGPTTIAATHLLGASRCPQLAHQQHLTILEHDLLATPAQFVDGALPVPTGPGLGIELDRDALAHYKKLFAEFGEFQGYGPIQATSPVPANLARQRSASPPTP
jgi:L-alanine-DL-glutamate epimerase-like enolase superfamily enzyme